MLYYVFNKDTVFFYKICMSFFYLGIKTFKNANVINAIIVVNKLHLIKIIYILRFQYHTTTMVYKIDSKNSKSLKCILINIAINLI